MCKRVVCFDLDDTLYKEIDFVKSAFGEIAACEGHPEWVDLMMQWFFDGENVFLRLNRQLGQHKPIADYLTVYRNHFPHISLSDGVRSTLDALARKGVVLGLITDGRSVSQRNKIKALGLEKWFADKNIIISEEFGSEKTEERNFCYFNQLYPEASFAYVGDNPSKDFLVPNGLGWETIMLKDDGRNIHRQGVVPAESLPHRTITDFEALLGFFR